MKQGNKFAPLMVIAAGSCWGVIGIFSKGLSARGLSAIQITEIRCLVTAAAMLLILLIADKKKLRIAPRDLPLFLGTGLMSIVFFNICYFMAIEQSSLSVASILLYTAPALVSLMSAFLFKEPMGRGKIAALCLSFLGCVLITGLLSGNAALSPAGILLGLGSGLGYALYSIFGRFALKKYHPMTVTAYTFFVASLGLLPFSDMGGIARLAFSSWGGLGYSLLLGLLSTLLPFLLYTEGLRHMEAGRASIMAFVEPMVATLCGILLFHEELTAMNLAGMGLIFISVVLLNRQGRAQGPAHRA